MSHQLLHLWPSYAAYASRSFGRRLIAPETDRRTIGGISRSFLPGIPLSTVATLSALVSAWLALGLYAGIALFYVLESSIFGRDRG